MNQTEYIESGSMENLGSILDNLHITKAFLVTGKKSFAECGAETYIQKIKNVEFIQFNNFKNDPRKEDVDIGMQLFRQSGADAIIALGGGSAIDMAKLIGHFSAKNKIPFLAIPTTAGSGSEATSFAVMYENKIKSSIEDKSILPDIVIIDPSLTMSLPPFITAVSGMDALCHAIESYWSINSTNESKEYAKKAMTIILNDLPETVNNPSVKLRLNMLLAANLAGKAINISKTTAAHAVSYALTSYFSVPHGLAVSFLIPDLLVYNYNVTENDAEDTRGVDYIKKNIDEIYHIFGGKNSFDAKNIFNRFVDTLGLPANLSSYGIKKSDIDLIISNINNERLKNNPRKIEMGEFRKLFELKC
ncbi:MAG: phosphonoacetaldehyde reductase [Treponema sp.]|nr:phosphonoacetaldehyde reductase [Treponema sp.]